MFKEGFLIITITNLTWWDFILNTAKIIEEKVILIGVWISNKKKKMYIIQYSKL